MMNLFVQWSGLLQWGLKPQNMNIYMNIFPSIGQTSNLLFEQFDKQTYRVIVNQVTEK